MINRLIAAVLPCMPKKLVWLFSKKYIAGETIEDAIRVSKELNARGMKVTIDLLGEFITNLEQAGENRVAYMQIIERTQAEKIQGNYSLKPTSFGLLLDPQVCYQNIREIVARAAACNSFVRIDMEDSPCTDLEINLLRRLHAEFPGHIGLVVQAYLKRTLTDLQGLMDLHSPEIPLNYRLCKGIYVEPETIAWQNRQEINRHFLDDLEFMLNHGVYAAIATHDTALVDGARQLIEKYRVPASRYEFQMLHGVTPDLRQSIVDQGHPMRVYVPFGKEWFGYSTRRLKENPAMATHIIKALFVRG